MRFRFLQLLLGAQLLSSMAMAQENTWQGGSGGDWNTAANWSLGLVPTSSHDAVVDGGSVAMPASPAAARLLIRSGTVSWTGGVAPFPVQISAGAVFELSGMAGKKIKGGITNAGTFRWGGAGSIFVSGSGASLVNQASGLVEFLSDAMMVRDPEDSGFCTIQNHGTLRKVSGLAAEASVLELDFQSHFGGSIEVQAGNLELRGGVFPSYEMTGTFTLGAGSDLRIVEFASIQFAPTANFQGPGSVSLGRSVALFEADKTLSGTYRGTAPLIWNGSRLAGEWTLAAGAICIVAGTYDRELAGLIHNAGVLRWTGSGNVTGVQGPFGTTGLDNLTGGLIDLQSDALLTGMAQPFPGIQFSNAGILRKSAGQAGSASRLVVSSVLEGSIELLQGNLEFPGGASVNAPVALSSGTELRVTSTLDLGTNATFDGPGAVCGGFLQPEFGDYLSIYGTYRGTAPLLWKSSHWSGNFTVASGALLRVVTPGIHEFAATLRIAGTMRIETPTDVIGGGSFGGGAARIEILSGGLFDLQADGILAYSGFGLNNLELVSAGTLRKSGGLSTGASTLSFVSPSGLGGTIELLQGNLEFPTGFEANATVHLAAGTEFRLSGTTNFSGDALFHGPGAVCAGFRQPQVGDYITFYGTYRGTAPLLWKSSFIYGDWTLGAAATLVAVTSGTHELNCQLKVAGTLRWETSGSILGGQFFGGSARLEILSAGVLDLRSDALLSSASGFPAGMILVNEGTIRKSIGQPAGGSALQLSLGSTMGGAIEVLQGNLDFPAGAEFIGQVSVAAGAECRLSGAVTFGSTAVFQGPGPVAAGYLQPGFGDYLGLYGTYRGDAPLVWRSCHVNGDWTIGAGAVLILESNGAHEFAGTVRNAGTLRWTTTAPLYGGGFAGPGRLENLAGGMLDLRSDAFLGRHPASFPSGLVLVNAGLIRKSAGLPSSGSALQLDAGSMLGGTIEIEQGNLEFPNGAEFAGLVQVAAATECRLSAQVTFGEFAVFQGPGAVTAGYLQPSFGDYLDLRGTFRGGAPLVWKSCHLSGDWTLGAGAVLKVATDGTHDLQGRMRNAGNVRWESNGPIYGGFEAVLENQPGGLIELLTDATLARHPTNFPASMHLTNAGIIRKSLGGAAPAKSIFGLDSFVQSASGRFEIFSGTVSFSNGFTQTNGETLLANGTLEAGSIQLLDGQLSGVGTLRGAVTNSAILRVGSGLSPGLLSVQGDFQSTGQIVARIGSAHQVNDRLEITGAVQLGGTLKIGLLGSAPASGTAFDVLAFTAGQGSSGSVALQAPALGSAQSLEQASGPNALQVRVQNSLSAWRDEVFGAEADNPAIAGNQADPNHNGLPNLFEYAFGLDPLSPAFGPVFARLPRIGFETSPGDGLPHLTLSFQRRLGSQGEDLDYVVESAPGLLGPWDASGAGLEFVGAPLPDADGITERVKVRVIAPLTSSPVRFLRLRVFEL